MRRVCWQRLTGRAVAPYARSSKERKEGLIIVPSSVKQWSVSGPFYTRQSPPSPQSNFTIQHGFEEATQGLGASVSSTTRRLIKKGLSGKSW